MKKIFVVLILSLMICGCENKENYKDLMKKNEYVILDVRSDSEYREEHVVDAINISYDKINKNIKLDKDKIIFVYCKSGKRSKLAYDKLSEYGYKVYDLGGISNIDLPKI